MLTARFVPRHCYYGNGAYPHRRPPDWYVYAGVQNHQNHQIHQIFTVSTPFPLHFQGAGFC